MHNDQIIETIVSSTSAPELKLKLTALCVDHLDTDDFCDILIQLRTKRAFNDEFMPVLCEIIRDTDLFDRAFGECYYDISFYLHAALYSDPSTIDRAAELKFKRFRMLDALSSIDVDSYHQYKPLFVSVFDKFEKINGKDYSILRNFKTRYGI